MSSRRRANNRGRGRASKTNLDDLDGALSGMIGKANAKVVVDLSEERRFTMHTSNTNGTSRAGVFASNLKEPIDTPGCQASQTSTFEKHQVNYGATKYIKP